MKKVAILTLYYKNYNYGGQLQAYALWRALTNLGYNAKQISFVRDRKKLISRKLRGFFEEPVTKDIFSVIVRKVRTKMLGNQDANLDNTINKFNVFMNNIPHSDVVTSQNIKSIEGDYDLFVVGSDQVWNPLFSTREFFFNFLDDAIPRISYAASIRINKYEKKEGKEIGKLLNKFGYISVREQRAVKTLEEIGVQKTINVLPDPSFLLSKEEWNAVAKPVTIDSKYIMVYLVRDPIALTNIRQFASAEGLKVVLISEPGFEEIEDNVFYSIREGVGPAEFIWLIQNATLVIANSFHGTAFSIIFNKPFYVYGNVNIDDRKATLLKKFKLTDRAISPDKRINHNEAYNMDYEYANTVISNERIETLNTINHVITNLI